MTARTGNRDRRSTKILYIEDNPENRMLARAILEAEGYTIIDAEDGLSGIEAAVREQPALILLDVNLPGVDGYEVVAILKSFPTLSSTPVIAVTAYAMEGDRQRTLVAGCDGYIQKPIDVDAFPRQVADFLQGKRERVEAREEGFYLRELNQRLVYRLLNQVEELKRLNQHFVRRAGQLEDLHRAVQGITSELDITTLLERLLPGLARALGSLSLVVELSDPPGVRVAASGDQPGQPHGALAHAGLDTAGEWTEVEWRLPLAVHGRRLGEMVARHVVPPGAKADEEQLLKIVANQVAIAVENSRLYEGVTRRAAEQESLVESGRLLTGTLQVSEVLQRLSELARTRFAADLVRIWLHEGGPGDFRLYAQAGATRQPPPTQIHLRAGEGLAGWIVEHRQPLVIPDLAVDARLKNRDWVTVEGLVSFMGVPLVLEDAPVGILAVANRERRLFSPDEVSLAAALATSAAAAIRNARLHEETQQRLRHTETLLAVSQAIGSTLDLKETMRRVARETAAILGADMVGAYLADADGAYLRPIAGYHVPTHLLDAFRERPIPLKGHGLLEEAWQHQQPRFSSDAPNDPRVDRATLERFPHQSVLFVPMMVKNAPIGGLFVVWWNERHEFTAEQLRLVDGISRQAALAVENGRLYDGVKRQMAELKQAQTQLIQSAKLAAIGELAANIAHEINNPLTSVLGFASYLVERLPADMPMRDELHLIQDEAARARDIVRDLLDFSRQREFSPAPADLNLVVEQTVAMVRRQGTFENIDVKEVYAADLPQVEVDTSRIKQVFLNIINNATYAMSGSGSLTIRTGAAGDFVQVEFTDTGTGIAPEYLDRIFEPFFTTKPTVSGTGLGLSVSLGIVQSHGGSIEVHSEAGQGATFRVKLPARAAAAPPARRTPASSPRPPA